MRDVVDADEGRDAHLRNRARVDVGPHVAFFLRAPQHVLHDVEPVGQERFHLRGQRRVLAEVPAQAGHRARSGIDLVHAARRARHGEQLVERALLAPRGLDGFGRPLLLLGSEHFEGEGFLGREVEVEGALGEARRGDDVVQ